MDGLEPTGEIGRINQAPARRDRTDRLISVMGFGEVSAAVLYAAVADLLRTA
jgi:hypothetical protein